MPGASLCAACKKGPLTSHWSVSVVAAVLLMIQSLEVDECRDVSVELAESDARTVLEALARSDRWKRREILRIASKLDVGQARAARFLRGLAASSAASRAAGR